ncbi:MAG: helix-turn-helix transcriptional regulator [Clostridia bacterium]|nr:helix-turn-helix transcriptional regulator [Clostridia bacterium]
MNLQTILTQKKMTMYRLSKISGVPKTTVIDICSGKSSIEGCNAKTVFLLSQALGCTMEELMAVDSADYERDTGLPKDKTYLEKGLPKYLQISLDHMKKSWEIEDSGNRDLHWDLYWCELYSDINSAEIDRVISTEQANYLRRVYLRMGKDDTF